MLQTSPTTRLAVPPPSVRKGATLLAAATSIAPLLIFGFVALYVNEYHCNESCGVSTQGWSHLRDGWQWGLQFWLLAIPTLAALATFVVFLGLGRPGGAFASMACSALGFLAWLYFPVLTGGATAPSLSNLNHSGPRLVALAVIVWLLGATISIAAEFLSDHQATDDEL